MSKYFGKIQNDISEAQMFVKRKSLAIRTQEIIEIIQNIHGKIAALHGVIISR